MTAADPSEAALVRRLLAGDEAAFATFFGAYFPRLYRFALNRVDADPVMAEDVVQAALCRAVSRLSSYRGEAALFTWLCTICRREIGERRRRPSAWREIALAEDVPEIRAALESLSSVAEDDDRLDRAEVARRVHVTLDHLPAKYGDALRWKYLDELPVMEIAQRLGIGVKAAESVLTRARAAFRDGFEALHGDRAGLELGPT